MLTVHTGNNSYQDAFRALLERRGPGTVSRVVRQAVLRATVDSPTEFLTAARDGGVVECRRACDTLERDLSGWSLSAGVNDLGRLVAGFPHRFGQAVLTSNFDPLIEISIQRAGGSCWRTTPQGDGSLQHSRGHGCHVVHVHGYWYDADTLHIPSQLQAERPQLRASLRRLFEDTTLVVVAYGGWDDVFSTALIDAVSDGGAFPEVIWTFFDEDEQTISGKAKRLLERLRPGMERAGRVTLYKGIDCHTLFRKLWERLPAGLELDAWEIGRSEWQGTSGELHRIAEDLSDCTGAELVQRLIRSLATFTDRFVRTECSIAIVARSSPDEFLLRGISEGLEDELLDRLSALSILCGDELKPWSGDERLGGAETTYSLGRAGVAIPLRFPGQRLSGHLFFLHQLPFSPAEIGLLLEVGRSVAVVIKAERDRHLLRAALARFRHSLLGPIQGLVSSARLLATLIEESQSDAGDLGKLRARLEGEAQTIRLLIENQRLSLAESPRLTPRRPESLRELLQTCKQRFQDVMAERGITLQLDWRIPGELTLHCDKHGLEVAISNLLDNAYKFSFARQPVILGAQVEGDRALIWVEDVGHATPEANRIYEPGAKSEIRDPFLTIPGEGLGLAVASAVVRAHDGMLSHSCESWGNSKDPTQSYRVRFTITLQLQRR